MSSFLMPVPIIDTTFLLNWKQTIVIAKYFDQYDMQNVAKFNIFFKCFSFHYYCMFIFGFIFSLILFSI